MRPEGDGSRHTPNEAAFGRWLAKVGMGTAGADATNLDEADVGGSALVLGFLTNALDGQAVGDLSSPQRGTSRRALYSVSDCVGPDGS